MLRHIFCILGSWPCAALPPLEAQIHEKTVLLQDLGRAMEDQLEIGGGFAVLRSGLPGGDVVGKSMLQKHDHDTIYRLRDTVLERLGFDWWFCGEGMKNLSMPSLPSPLFSFLNALPMALPKIILLFRTPMRPFAVRQGFGENVTWWWHSNLSSGNVLVVDQLRSSVAVAQVPGEEGLQEAQKAAQRLQAVLEAAQDQGQGSPDVLETSKSDFTQELSEVSKVCGDLEVHLSALDYPRLGDRYEVHFRPALIRRFEHVESDLLGEVRVGKSVTIIKHGTESPGRVQIYTEDALVMPGYISNEINEVSTPGISGWISSTTYNGSRLLIQRDLKETPVLEAARSELASVVLGTCEWFRLFRLSDSSSGSTAALLRAKQRLTAAAAASPHRRDRPFAELQCVAVRYPKRSEMLVLIFTLVTLFFGCVLFAALSAASAY